MTDDDDQPPVPLSSMPSPLDINHRLEALESKVDELIEYLRRQHKNRKHEHSR